MTSVDDLFRCLSTKHLGVPSTNWRDKLEIYLDEVLQHNGLHGDLL